MHDPDGIDVCLSTLPTGVTISDVTDESGKKAVQKLTKTKFDSVNTPLLASQDLHEEARLETDEILKADKNAEADAKYQEAVAALHTL